LIFFPPALCAECQKKTRSFPLASVLLPFYPILIFCSKHNTSIFHPFSLYLARFLLPPVNPTTGLPPPPPAGGGGSSPARGWKPASSHFPAPGPPPPHRAGKKNLLPVSWTFFLFWKHPANEFCDCQATFGQHKNKMTVLVLVFWGGEHISTYVHRVVPLCFFFVSIFSYPPLPSSIFIGHVRIFFLIISTLYLYKKDEAEL